MKLEKEGKIDFEGWNFGDFGIFEDLINKSLAEVLESELSEGKAHCSLFGVEEGKLELCFGFEAFDDLWFKLSIIETIKGDVKYWDSDDREQASNILQSLVDEIRNMK